jgi:hypothetical protein
MPSTSWAISDRGWTMLAGLVRNGIDENSPESSSSEDEYTASASHQ